MQVQHHYKATVQWTGNKGTGTDNYRNYERSHQIIIENKSNISGSSDPAFRGDKTKHNPEDFLVTSLSSCHMLWFLHLCAESGVIVMDYIDKPIGILIETANDGGRFKEVTLNPTITVTDITMIDKIDEIHKKANELCFIANSVNFPVYHKSTCLVINN